MSDLLFSAADRLSERNLSTKLKITLGFIFVASVASNVFTTFYFEYQLLDTNESEHLYRFFIDGHFFIPLAIFFLIWMISDYGGLILFKLSNMAITKKIRRKIVAYSTQKYSSRGKSNDVESIGRKFIDESTETFFSEMKKKLEPHEYNRIQKAVTEGQARIESMFILLFRGFIAMIFYYVMVPYFGGLMFAILILSFFIWSFFLALAYQFIEFSPFLISVIINWEGPSSKK
jgi:hypothetical protein